MAVNPPAQAARVVLAATRPMPTKSIAESVLPGLNPYQPNHRNQSAGNSDGQVVRQHRSAAVALERAAEARAENNRAGQRDHSADRVDDRGAGEVMEAHSRARARNDRRCPSVPASRPDPMPSDR